MSLDERFDPHLAQAENLTTLFVAVHDGVSLCVGVGGGGGEKEESFHHVITYVL